MPKFAFALIFTACTVNAPVLVQLPSPSTPADMTERDMTPVPDMGPFQCGDGNVLCNWNQVCRNGDCVDQ